MRALACVLLLLTIGASGCVVEAMEPLETTQMQAHLEPSMMPNFGTGKGPSYRFVLLHQHVFPTPEEERRMNDPNQPRVVCLRLDGLEAADMLKPKAESAPAADMAAAKVCEARIDAGRGRLFMERKEFERADPMAVVLTDPCGGALVSVTAAQPGFLAQAPAHSFRAEFLANDTLLIDGRWHVEPGQSLKIDYTVRGPRAGGDDDRRVKFVFDYAGFWLASNVGPLDPNEPPAPPGPQEGNGPSVWVPRQPKQVGELLEPMVEEYGAQGLAHLRFTTLEGNVTDLQVATTGSQAIWWFVAGGNETHLRVIGVIGRHDLPGQAEITKFRSAFDTLPLQQALSQAGESVEVRWRPDTALRSRMLVEWSETWVQPVVECAQDCAFVWTSTPTSGPAWRYADGALSEAAEKALTLAFSKSEDGKLTTQAVYHRPE